MWWSGALVLMLGGGCAAPLWGQWTIDVGATNVRYDDLPARSGVVFAPAWRRGWARSYLAVITSAAAFDDGAWSAEWQSIAAVRTHPAWQSGLELLGGLGSTTARQSDATVQGWTRARAHLIRRRADLWAGIGGGGVHSTLTDRSLATAEAGVTWSAGRWRVMTSGGATALSDGTRYAEGSGSLRLDGGTLALTIGGGGRQEWAPVVNDVGWVTGSVEIPTDRLGTVVLSAGTFPADLAQDLAEGRYVSVSLRLGVGRRGGLLPPRAGTPHPSADGPDGVRAEFRRRGNDSLEITVRAPGARRVEVAGDFSDWTPVPLVRRGERWRVRIALARGVHPIGLRLDGGTWRAPPGTMRTADEFGGEVGLLVVE